MFNLGRLVKMRVFFGLLFVFFIIGPLSHKTEAVQYEDNEFAEFEDFDEGQINGEVPTISKFSFLFLIFELKNFYY